MQDSRVNRYKSIGEKSPEDGNKTVQCTVTCVYQVRIKGSCRLATVTWVKNLLNYSLSISVDRLYPDENPYLCKIDLKPWHFWSKRGLKSFEVDSKRIDVYWDLRNAKFSGSPEPMRDYYIAIVSDQVVVLLLGDMKKEAYKRTKSRPSLIDAALFLKKENVVSRKGFSTRARFDGRSEEHDIVIENSISGIKTPEMWISVDGIVLIHVTNLQWKFRGNESVWVNQIPIQVFWDVHDWLFTSPGLGHGFFIFKSASPEMESDDENSANGGDDENTYFSVESQLPVPPFCLHLYAWKIE